MVVNILRKCFLVGSPQPLNALLILLFPNTYAYPGLHQHTWITLSLSLCKFGDFSLEHLFWIYLKKKIIKWGKHQHQFGGIHDLKFFIRRNLSIFFFPIKKPDQISYSTKFYHKLTFSLHSSSLETEHT